MKRAVKLDIRKFKNLRKNKEKLRKAFFKKKKVVNEDKYPEVYKKRKRRQQIKLEIERKKNMQKPVKKIEVYSRKLKRFIFVIPKAKYRYSLQEKLAF